ncbi:MAG: (2Fe-2S)-binding protein [Gammaproteobacteria bacterium]
MEAQKKSGVVCTCSGTTRDQLIKLIDDGVDNLDRLSRITGALSGCGACDTEILGLLAEHGRFDREAVS